MIKSKLINTLKEWAKVFQGIQIELYYDSTTDYYIVIVGPEEIRRGNEDYKKKELELYTSSLTHNSKYGLLITNKDSFETINYNLLYKNF